MKPIIRTVLCILFACQLFTLTVLARPSWPADTGVQADGGIVVDADSGAVLFGQNIHNQYPPASITKLLTALVVIERCQLDETVTFSHSAIYDVESGSGNSLGLEEGDKLSVENCLYALLLRSSNQAANALAEHVAGSKEVFVQLMNEKAASLGCAESNFVNPSGLNDPNHLVTAYDMALIARAAFANPKLLEIDSTLKHTLPPTINHPDGLTISMEHKLLITENAGDPNYYPQAVAGKTGYTSLAGQTLVTYAVDGDRRLIAVILKSRKTHYSDTLNLLKFGFDYFQNVNISQNETSYVTGVDPVIIGDQSYLPDDLMIDPGSVITLPKNASFTDADRNLITDPNLSKPAGAVALLHYTYNERIIGQAWLYDKESLANAKKAEEAAANNSSDNTEAAPKNASTSAGAASAASASILSSQAASPSSAAGPGFLPFSLNLDLIPGGILTLSISVALLFLVTSTSAYIWHCKRQEARELAERRERRRQRLREEGCSEEEFERLLRERLNAGRNKKPTVKKPEETAPLNEADVYDHPNIPVDPNGTDALDENVIPDSPDALNEPVNPDSPGALNENVIPDGPDALDEPVNSDSPGGSDTLDELVDPKSGLDTKEKIP